LLEWEENMSFFLRPRKGTATGAVLCSSVSLESASDSLCFPGARNKSKPEWSAIWSCYILSSLWMDRKRASLPYLFRSKASSGWSVLVNYNEHPTHTKSFALLEKVPWNHVDILCVPLHTSEQKKTLLSIYVTLYHMSLPRKRYMPQEVSRENCDSWSRCLEKPIENQTACVAENGFTNTDICPFCTDIFLG
jgi:hypothetical protein